MNFLSQTIWERKYIDLWAVEHFLTGFFCAFAIFIFGLDFKKVFVIFLIGIILWEIGERLFSIDEMLVNSVVDIFIGVLGFISAYYFIPKIAHDQSQLYKFAAVVAILLIAYSFFAWYAFSRYSSQKNSVIKETQSKQR